MHPFSPRFAHHTHVSIWRWYPRLPTHKPNVFNGITSVQRPSSPTFRTLPTKTVFGHNRKNLHVEICTLTSHAIFNMENLTYPKSQSKKKQFFLNFYWEIWRFLSKFILRKLPKNGLIMNQIFINISLSTLYDSKRKKIRVRPTQGQNVPELWVSCSKKQRNQMVIGTVFKTNVKLIESEKRKPYLKATTKILGQLSLFWKLYSYYYKF